MNLKKVLSTDIISMEIKATGKEAIISEIIDMLYDAKKIKAKDTVLAEVLKRESQMSTGIQAGVAIPHGKCDDVPELVAAIALSKEGKDFKSLDGKPSQIFVMTLSPSKKSGPHVQFLAEISRLLTKADVREGILKASTKEEVLKLFLG